MKRLNPVAQRLAIHAADLRRRRPVHSNLEPQPDDRTPTALPDVLRPVETSVRSTSAEWLLSQSHSSMAWRKSPAPKQSEIITSIGIPDWVTSVRGALGITLLRRDSRTLIPDVIAIGGGHNGRPPRRIRPRRAESHRAQTPLSCWRRGRHRGILSLLPQLCRRYTVSLLNPKIIRDLKLHRHGLHILEGPLSNFLPRPTDTI